MDLAAHLDTAAFGAILSAASAVLVPRIIERVPEPEPKPDEPTGPGDPSGPGETGGPDQVERPDEPRFEGATSAPEPPKETYFAIADRPGLLWRCLLAGALAGGVVGLSVGWDWSLLFLLPLVPVSIALAVIDWRTRLLPTWLIGRTYIGLVVLVLVTAAVTQDWQDLVRAAIGWVGAGLLFFVLWYIHPRGLGYGDVRLSGILGIALGYVGTSELVIGIYAAFLLGGVGGGLLSLLRLVERKGFPFGPFMLIGALVGLLTGDWLAGLVTG